MSVGETIPCYICEKPFIKYRNNSKCCSDKCRNASVPIKNKVKKCPQCSKKFIPPKRDGKYCSIECRSAFIRIKQRRPLQDKSCAKCETVFKPISGSQLYCGFECKNAARVEAVQKSKNSENGKAKTKEYNKTYKRFPDQRSMRDRNLKSCYGISIEQYEQMSLDQSHLCAICDKPPPGKKPLCVEHHHLSGKVRGLACIKCNNILGNSDDDIKILCSAIKFLIKHHPEKLDEIPSFDDLIRNP